MMCKRANTRITFGEPLADKQFIQDFVATSRMEIDQARLMVLYAAWKMDTLGKKAARQEISMIKVIAAQMFMRVLDRAIQVHGASASPTTRRSPACGATAACCASPTVPTRCTRWWSRGASSSASRAEGRGEPQASGLGGSRHRARTAARPRT